MTNVDRAGSTLLALLLLTSLSTGASGGSVLKGVKTDEAVVQTHNGEEGEEMRIVFLHHSTGGLIWKAGIPEWFQEYNRMHGTGYEIEALDYPRDRGNFPHDYWELWVKYGGFDSPGANPTLESLTEEYDVIIWKHCFPVSLILKDKGNPDIDSDEKRQENYKLQYEALRDKMRQFPDHVFIVWTGAAVVNQVSLIGRIVSFLRGGSEWEEQAKRAQEFFRWVKDEWDEPGDNIYIWDFYQLETEAGLYLKTEYAAKKDDSHPGRHFSQIAAPLLCQRIIDVIEGRGDSTSLTGERSQLPQ